MKNTVKKILALVFVVAMVCSLAVPAFAADEFTKYNVKLIIVDADGKGTEAQNVEIASAKKANVLDALKAAETTGLDFTFKNNVLTSAAVTGLDFETDDEFDTASLVVALNGKAITSDLSTVAVAKDDVIVVYWADSTIGTKLAVVDDSAIAQGIVSFYYYDAEGNKQPIVDAKIKLNDGDILNKLVVTAKDENGVATDWSNEFVTDEKGQIWIAPQYLNVNAKIAYNVTSFAPKALEQLSEDDGYTAKEVKYFTDYSDTYVVDEVVNASSIVIESDLYNVAGATGDMTVVYALVAFAAVATLAAVVVMKKKSVKAN